MMSNGATSLVMDLTQAEHLRVILYVLAPETVALAQLGGAKSTRTSSRGDFGAVVASS